ncbi:MAG: carboxymuconolactone decarboxylase family protein [Rhodospirillales bacterium]
MSGPDRLPPIPPGVQTPEQAAACERFRAVRGNAVFGPFVPLLRSPELMLRLQMVGEYCRYRSAIGHRLTEFAILMVARRHDQPVDWAIHAPLAATAGTAASVIDDLAADRRPAGMTEDEALVFDTVRALWDEGGLSDAAWAAAVARFGEAGLIDLIATVGYYATIAQVMNAARTAPPPGPTLPARRA